MLTRKISVAAPRPPLCSNDVKRVLVDTHSINTAYHDALQTTAGDKQRTLIRQRLLKVVNGVGITTITGLTTEAVQGWMNRSKIARRTKHHYRTAIRSFGQWLAGSGRLPRSPVADLEPIRNIEAMMIDWRRWRPGAENGDAQGRAIELSPLA